MILRSSAMPRDALHLLHVDLRGIYGAMSALGKNEKHVVERKLEACKFHGLNDVIFNLSGATVMTFRQVPRSSLQDKTGWSKQAAKGAPIAGRALHIVRTTGDAVLFTSRLGGGGCIFADGEWANAASVIRQAPSDAADCIAHEASPLASSPLMPQSVRSSLSELLPQLVGDSVIAMWRRQGGLADCVQAFHKMKAKWRPGAAVDAEGDCAYDRQANGDDKKLLSMFWAENPFILMMSQGHFGSRSALSHAALAEYMRNSPEHKEACLAGVEAGVEAAIEAAIEAGDPKVLKIFRSDKALSLSEKMGSLTKLGHAKSAAANSDARALMEDEPELTPGGALTKLGMAPLVASQRMAKDALEHTWSAEQHRSLDQAAASAAAVASAALWQPSAAAVPPQPSMAVPPPAPTAASQESPTPPPKPHGWTDADWRHFSAVATDGVVVIVAALNADSSID